jgi:hypothetical protein
VRDITVHGDDLVIATHGRGFYVMDDIVTLRALAALPVDATRLFPVATAIRVNEPDFTGTPMPKDEPMAPNPPFGAYIDYNLASAPRTPVVIRILDSSSALVDTFSSTGKPNPLDLSTLEVAPEWTVSPAPPAASSGAHRFVWDLRYAPPPAFKDDREFPGVWARPGRYTVELDVDGQQFRQPFEIRPDPRIAVSQSEFEAQFGLARQIERARVRAHSMIKDAAALKDKLAAGQDKALIEQIDAIAGTAPPPEGSSDVTTLLGISDRLDTLAGAVESADGAPTPDNLRGFTILSAALDAIEHRWNSLRGQLPQQLAKLQSGVANLGFRVRRRPRRPAPE